MEKRPLGVDVEFVSLDFPSPLMLAAMPSPRRRTLASVQTPLETYLREINETALLTADDEQQLAVRIGQGDSQARDRMVRANLRLVVNIARGYTGKGLGLQDLIEEGNLGLLRAVEGFDPAMGTRFSTYASYWIKQSIKRALINSAKTIRIPAYMVELLSKWRRASARLTEELGRTPTPEEVGRILGLQAVGMADVARKVDVISSLIQKGGTVFDLEEAELCYAPQFGGAKDALNYAGFIAANHLRGDLPLSHWNALPEGAFLLDVRDADEFAEGHPEGAVLIPLPQLRDRLDELPKDKTLHVYCGVGQRAYYAVRQLQQHGFDARDISGGMITAGMVKGI